MIDTPDHLSVSQLKMYLRCPLQYKFRYIDGLKIPPPSAVSLGKSVHSALEENYKQKIKSKIDLPLEQVQDLFSDAWEALAKDTLFEEDEKPGQVKDDGIKLLTNYHRIVAPKIQPAQVERKFNLDLEDKYKLKGIIDLIDDKKYIVDHKTTKRSMREEDVKNDPQLTAYSLAYRELEGKKEKGLRFDVMVRTKKPKVQQIKTYRSQDDIDRLQKLFRYVREAIDSEMFYPRRNFMCGNCGYKKLCEEW